MTDEKKKWVHRGYFLQLNGLHATVRSKSYSARSIKSMLVSPSFIDLWRLINDDHSFDKELFSRLSEPERDFMAFILKKFKIDSREFQSANNALLAGLIERLNMIDAAMKMGNDSPVLKKEMLEILDTLYEKSVFSQPYYSQLRKKLCT